MTNKLFIAGITAPTHIGLSLKQAAVLWGMETKICDTREAFCGPVILSKMFWVFDRRPLAMGDFSRRVLKAVGEYLPKWVLSTGLSPIDRNALRAIKRMGIKTLNYLTDDPWNRAHFSRWFMAALPEYDVVYSTKAALLNDLKETGCKDVQYLPFGYDPELFYPETLTNEETKKYVVGKY